MQRKKGTATEAEDTKFNRRQLLLQPLVMAKVADIDLAGSMGSADIDPAGATTASDIELVRLPRKTSCTAKYVNHKLRCTLRRFAMLVQKIGKHI